MAHDVTYLVCKNKSFVEGYSKEQMEKGDFTAGNALKLNGKEESQLDVHSADSAAYATEAGYLRYGGFMAGTINGTNGLKINLKEGWTYLCIADYSTFIFSVPIINDKQENETARLFKSNLTVRRDNEHALEYLRIEYRFDDPENSTIRVRYQDTSNDTWATSDEQLAITVLPIIRTTSQNV